MRNKLKTYNKKCLRCGKEFFTKRESAKYCSISCGKRKIDDKICKSCNEIFKPVSKHTIYCSMKCRDKGKSKFNECLACKKMFKVTIGVVNRGRNAGNFCSSKCYSIFSKASNNPNWRGGGSFVRGSDWKLITKKVRSRDNFTCNKCGKIETDKKHDVHHKIPYRINQDNSESNLITLCISCHRKETKSERLFFEKK